MIINDYCSKAVKYECGDKVYSVYDKTPVKLHYGSVTVGGVTSGGLFTTGGNIVEGKMRFKDIGDRYEIVCYSDQGGFTVQEIKVTPSKNEKYMDVLDEKIKKDYGRIHVYNYKDYNDSKVAAGIMASRGIMSKVSEYSALADALSRFGRKEIESVVSFLNALVQEKEISS